MSEAHLSDPSAARAEAVRHQAPVVSSGGHVFDEVISEVDAVVHAVLLCPAVARLDSGGIRRVATYLPGRQVAGVRLDEDHIAVSVAVRLGVSVSLVDQQVRRALAPLSKGRRVDVHIVDVELPVPPGRGPSAERTIEEH